MDIRFASVAAAVLALWLPSAAHATGQNTKPPSGATPTFHDANGHTITATEFVAAGKAGQRYVAKPDHEHKTMVLTLLPPGVNTPGSLSLKEGAPHKQMSVETFHEDIDGVHYQVVFHDQAGKTISLKSFVAGAPQQQRFTTHMDRHSATETLTLLPIGKNEPGSEPTSTWAKLTSPTSLAVVPKRGTVFPAIELPEVGGGRVDAARLKGEPYLVDFFFADCVGCIEELPMLNTYHQQYPSLRVLALTHDDAKTAAAFVKQRHFAWPVAYDGKAFLHKLGIEVYPTLVLVGADGKVLATRVGSHTDATAQSLERWVAKGLAAASPTAAH